MTQAELNRAVARATGESVNTISNLGFVPLTGRPIEREPMGVDWDDLDAGRVGLFPARRLRRRTRA
ncbi:MAG: hypothetical protein ACYC35_26410 [Pirellulales bacterium]